MATPIHPAIIWCALVTPFAHALAGRLTASINDSFPRPLLRCGLAAASWLVAVHVSGLATGTFVRGLIGGSAAITLLGALPLFRWLRHGSLGVTRAPVRAGAGLLGIALVAMALMYPTIWSTDIHDKINLGPQGHFAYLNQLANDVTYPPTDIVFPDLPRHYHFGVYLPVVFAMASFGLRVDQATDLIELLTWGWIATLLATLAWQLLGRRYTTAVVAGLCASLAGGITFFGTHARGGVLQINGQMVLPPFTNVFFQMPFALGTALALTAVGLFAALSTATHRGALSVGLAVVLAALTFVNSTLFLTCAGAMGGALLLEAVVHERSFRLWRSGWRWPLVGVAAAVLAFFLLNSVWSSVMVPGQSRLVFNPKGFAGTPAASLRYAVEIFGAMLIVPVMLVAWPRLLGLPGRGHIHSVFLLLLVAGCLLAYNFVRYTMSWDIIKFATVAQIALGLLAAGGCGRALASRRIWLRVFGVAALVALCWQPAAGLLRTAQVFYFKDSSDLDRNAFRRHAVVCAPPFGWSELIKFLRFEIRPGECVLSEHSLVTELALTGGIPAFEPTGWEPHFGVPSSRYDRRKALASELPREAAPFLAEKVRLVVSNQSDGPIGQRLAVWVQRGDATLLAQFGTFRVAALSTQVKTASFLPLRQP